ncbi:MAG: hypothetical protein VW405_14235 [Rhodospirillaceae bacterium]
MYNYFFIPKVNFTRKDNLEAAIDLMSGDTGTTRFLAAAVRRHRWAPIGFVVGLLASLRYRQTFGRSAVLINARRVYLGARMLLRGDLKALFGKMRKVLQPAT